jgi:hypothetical protein
MKGKFMSKSKDTLIAKLGSEKAYRLHMKNIRGMVKDHPRKGSFNDPEFAKAQSKKGVDARKAKKHGLQDIL